MNYSPGGIRWTYSLGRIRGIEIKLHLLLIIFVILQLLGSFKHGAITVLIHLLFILAFFALILWHELGHAYAARKCGMHIVGIMLWPLGGECQLASPMPSPRVEIITALGGPVAHLLALIAVLPLLLLPVNNEIGGLLVSLLKHWWIIGAFILGFNLIPMFPLDGGRVLRGLLVYRLGGVKATEIAVRISQGFCLLIGLAGFGLLGIPAEPMLLIIAIFIAFTAENEFRRVRFFGGCYQGPGDDWSRQAVDNYGSRPRDNQESKPGFFANMRIKRQLKRLARETARRQEFQAETDRILSKVSEEGMPSLTAKERKTLQDASDQYNKR
jgi:Zn-dependent protease